jgi:hypothetical protein
MNEPRRLLQGVSSPLMRRLLEAGLAERPDPGARARAWRACAGEGLRTASTFDGSARSFRTTASRVLNLAMLPGWMRRAMVLAGVATLAGACGFSLWFLRGRPAPAPSHYAGQARDMRLGEQVYLDRAEALLTRGNVVEARREIARYRHHYPNGKLSARVELLELQARALDPDGSMDPP